MWALICEYVENDLPMLILYSTSIPNIIHTIDWLRDIARNRMRHRHIMKKRMEGCWEQLKGAHDAWSGWVCVLLVGVAAGEPTQNVPKSNLKTPGFDLSPIWG